MNPVQVRGVTIGAGKPKIAAPITGADEAEILRQADVITASAADIAEWRMDCFSQVENSAAVVQCLCALRRQLGETPLLATFRTAAEGGVHPMETAAYRALNEAVIASGCTDLLDVELFSGEDTVAALLDSAHSAQLKVVLSNHDFEKTPPREELLARLQQMQDLGGDVLKLAVMPRSRADVLTLLSATEEMHTHYARQPLVTMSMGAMGMVSRICGGCFGSALTFGAAARASAPGQLDVASLAQILSCFPPEMLP